MKNSGTKVYKGAMTDKLAAVQALCVAGAVATVHHNTWVTTKKVDAEGESYFTSEGSLSCGDIVTVIASHRKRKGLLAEVMTPGGKVVFISVRFLAFNKQSRSMDNGQEDHCHA